jgi:glycosyltransferase involved in cell wall biosynthesis
MLRSLAARFDVRLVVPSSGSDNSEGRAAFERAGVEPRLVVVPGRTVVGESRKALVAAVRREPYVMFARHHRRAVAEALRGEVSRRAPDVMYLDHLDSLLYAVVQSDAPLVIDMHNVYSQLAARTAEAQGAVRRQYFGHEAALLARMERRAVQIAHTIIAVSDDDARYFSELGARHVVVVPNGVECETYEGLPTADRSGPPTILYVGSHQWPPNAQAAHFLATAVLPEVRRHLPETRLAIVGKCPAPELLALAASDERVEIAANVPDVIPYLRRAHVLAVPLQAGGGTRLKILEAFAAGLPVVSTPIGCEGIRARNGEHLVVADRSDFAAALMALLLDPGRARALAGGARRVVRSQYDWRTLGASACEAVAFAGCARRAERRPELVAATLPSEG